MDKRKSVLELVMLGKTTKEISKQLMMTISSVRYYREPSKSDRARQISDHRRKIKRKAVDYSGGKCLRCGYNKCYAALVFHHLDPNEKEHGLALGNTWGWRKTKKEVDKCILICYNCHAEHHNGIWEPSVSMIEDQSKIRCTYTNKPLIDYGI